MIYMLEKDGTRISAEAFRDRHRNIAYSGALPPASVLAATGYALVQMPPSEEDGRAECHRRILAVVDRETQLNLAAAAAVDGLTTAQRAAYIEGLDWISAMRAAWPALIASGADLFDDSNWPAPPESAAALVAAY